MKKTRRWLALILAIVLVAVSGFYQLGTSLQASVDQSTVETAGGDGENQILEGNVDAGNNQDTNNQDSDSNEESKGDGQIDVQEISGDSESNDANEDSNQSEEDTDAQNDENSIQQVSEGLGTSLTANEDGSVSGSGYDSIILEINTNGITNQNNTSFNITFDTGNTDNNNKIKASNLNPNGGVASNLKKNNAGTFIVEGFDKNAFTITVSVGTGSKNSVRTAASVDQSEGKVVLTISDYYESSYTGGTFTCPSATSLGSVNNFAVFANNYKNHVDMEGNIAVKNMLLANTNGGNTEKVQENDFNLNYVENFVLDSMKAEFFRLADPLIVGNDYEITTQDSNFYLTLSSGAKINLGPSNKMKDVVNIKNSSYKIDFAAAMEGLKAYANNLYGKSDTAGLVFKDSNGDVTTASGNVQTIECKTDVNNIINIKASDLQKWAGAVQLNNLGNSGSLVFNIEYDQEKEFTKPHFKINNSETGGYVADGGRILLNFGDQTGALSFGELYSGTILAPNATVYIKTTHNGSVFADTVENVSGEIHKNPWKPGDDDENQSVSVSFKGSKTLDGEPAEANKFSFILQETDADGNLVTGGYQETVENTDNGVVAFNAITYNAPGTYYYQITEVEGNDSNINYDTSVYKVTVTVDADMKAAVAYTKNGQAVDPNTGAIFSFANSSKEIIKTSAKLQAIKMLDHNKAKKDAFAFTFTQVDENGNELAGGYKENVKNQDQGLVESSSISYKATGTYYYKITENAGDDEDIVYDSSFYTAVVKVTLDGQNLSADVKYYKNVNGKDISDQTTAEDAEFNNTTRNCSGSVTFTGNKTLNGQASTDVFSYKVTEKSQDGKNKQDGYSKTIKNGSDGKLQFEKIPYTKEGTYYYEVKEVDDSDTTSGITYDETVYTAVVTVSKDNSEGSTGLKAEVKYYKTYNYDAKTGTEVSAITFANTMSTSVDLEGSKTLDGKAVTKAGEYKFDIIEVKNTSGDPLEGASSQTVSNDKDGNFKFPTYTYGNAGVHYYKITENVSDKKDDIKYDTSSYIVTVTVTKTTDKDGKISLQAKKTITKTDANGTETETDKITFNNQTVSTKETDIQLTASKNLAGEPSTKSFDFELVECDADGKTSKGEKALSASNDEKGYIQFEKITYKEAGTHYYKMKEVIPEEAEENITYDTSSYIVKVEVTKDKTSGQLIAVASGYQKLVTGEDGETTKEPVESLVFNNEMTASTSFEGEKYVDGELAAETEAGKYSFTLTRTDESFAEALTGEDAYSDTVFNDEAGKITFKEITYKVPGQYYYTISENEPEDPDPNMYYDEAVYRAKVTVSQDGTVEVEKSVVPYEGYEEDNGVESEPVEDDEFLMFNNYGFMLMSMNYGMADITGAKTLIGGNLEAGEFRFGLYDEDGDLIDTTTNDASGAIEFRTLSYFNEGEYHYTVKEIQEEEGKNAGNISYDTSVYDVTVEVNEYMDTTVSYTKDGIAVDGITFENKMAVTAAVIDPGVTKELNNAKLQPGEFTFQLFDENNNLVDTKKNTDSGSVLFDSVIFDKEGEYHYTIKELIPEDKGQIIYDGREIGVTVKVTKNKKEGALESTVTYTEDGKETTDPTFVNTYHPISICVQKTSKDGSKDPLQGATYALYRVLGFGGRSLLVDTQLSNASGYMTFDNVEPGIYYFKEVSAPAGHTVDEYATKKFVVSDDGSITSYVETDNNSDLLAQANQEDQKDTSTAEAQLFADVEPLATAANTSSLSFENIEDLATAANTDTEGLARASAGSSAEETSTDSTILAEEIAEAPGVSDEVTKLYVSKLDATNHEFVSGAKLQIIEKESGKVVEEWTTGESAEGFERKLNVETPYILHEVSAPEGYKLAEDTEFIIDAYGILSITSGSDAEKTSDTSLSLYDKKLGVTKTTVNRTEKHNTKYVDKTIAGADTTTTAKTRTVKTGDTARIALFAISALAAVAIAVVVIRKRKDS